MRKRNNWPTSSLFPNQKPRLHCRDGAFLWLKFEWNCNREVALEIEVDEGQNGVAFVIGRNNRDFQLQQEILIDHGADLVCDDVELVKGNVVLRCHVDGLR